MRPGCRTTTVQGQRNSSWFSRIDLTSFKPRSSLPWAAPQPHGQMRRLRLNILLGPRIHTHVPALRLPLADPGAAADLASLSLAKWTDTKMDRKTDGRQGFEGREARAHVAPFSACRALGGLPWQHVRSDRDPQGRPGRMSQGQDQGRWGGGCSNTQVRTGAGRQPVSLRAPLVPLRSLIPPTGSLCKPFNTFNFNESNKCTCLTYKRVLRADKAGGERGEGRREQGWRRGGGRTSHPSTSGPAHRTSDGHQRPRRSFHLPFKAVSIQAQRPAATRTFQSLDREAPAPRP